MSISFGQQLGCDVVTVDVGGNGKTFKVHKNLLCDKVPVFAAMFNGGFQEASTGLARLPEDDEKAFEYFLGWLYRGTLDIVENCYQFFNLYGFAEKYNLEELMDLTMDALIDHLERPKEIRIAQSTPLQENAPSTSFEGATSSIDIGPQPANLSTVDPFPKASSQPALFALVDTADHSISSQYEYGDEINQEHSWNTSQIPRGRTIATHDRQPPKRTDHNNTPQSFNLSHATLEGTMSPDPTKATSEGSRKRVRTRQVSKLGMKENPGEGNSMSWESGIMSISNPQQPLSWAKDEGKKLETRTGIEEPLNTATMITGSWVTRDRWERWTSGGPEGPRAVQPV
ncbi:hypothetical protein DL98DRAFT_586179 [Cadophora sp. DSE1049]|nr:hypothetical protein DL98DRAFT_586179 [Cadophora sp. DSE1049]